MYLKSLVVLGFAAATTNAAITTHYFDSKVDHFDHLNTDTYKQRYFEDTQYFNEDEGPVFLYICGEGTCYPSEGLFGQEAQAHEALQYWVEHRYYGDSQPVSSFDDAQDYKFLSSEQALEDLADFITAKKAALPKRKSGLDRRWVVVGGSYPGALSAWFRYKYPHLADISWASSGVVHAITNFVEYDHSIYNSTLKGGQDCVDVFQGLTNWIDGQIEKPDPATVKKIQQIMFIDNLVDV